MARPSRTLFFLKMVNKFLDAEAVFAEVPVYH